jgi:hypothetical protein
VLRYSEFHIFFSEDKEKIHKLFPFINEGHDPCQKCLWFYLAPYTPTSLNAKLNTDAFLQHCITDHEKYILTALIYGFVRATLQKRRQISGPLH